MRFALRVLLVTPVLASGVLTLACGDELDESLTNLEVGDCVLDPGVAESEVDQLDSVDCDDPNAVEVVSTFEIEDNGGFPGATEIQQAAQNGCPPDAIFYLYPTEESWNQADDRLVVCFRR